MTTTRELLLAERARARRQAAALDREFAGIADAAGEPGTDDEHDPEGATLAFERQHTAALLARALERIAEIDAAIGRLDDGTYGTCARCGQPVGEDRLAARPTAATCVRCARLTHVSTALRGAALGPRGRSGAHKSGAQNGLRGWSGSQQHGRVQLPADFAIREAREDDWPKIWPIIHDVITEQQTFAYDPAMSEGDAKRGWLLAAPARAVVAASGSLVLGTANMYANRPGPGSHVASGSLMVARQARGKGVGRALTTDMISWARRSGFAAIQFNAVVDANTAAVLLYESLGFVTLGTAPGAFRHPVLGPVGLRIMWLDLRHPANASAPA